MKTLRGNGHRSGPLDCQAGSFVNVNLLMICSTFEDGEAKLKISTGSLKS